MEINDKTQKQIEISYVFSIYYPYQPINMENVPDYNGFC